MSNIGRERIIVPQDVNLKVLGWKIWAKGKHGEFTMILPKNTNVTYKENYLSFKNLSIPSSQYGSLQRKLKILINGLSLEYLIVLKLVGVGYRARVEEKMLILRLGYSHEIVLEIPSNLKLSVIKRNNIRILGPNYEDLRQFSYKIRSIRKPEPFKGKGVVILGEEVRRKEGKKKFS